jgi:hypothetical protein
LALGPPPGTASREAWRGWFDWLNVSSKKLGSSFSPFWEYYVDQAVWLGWAERVTPEVDREKLVDWVRHHPHALGDTATWERRFLESCCSTVKRFAARASTPAGGWKTFPRWFLDWDWGTGGGSNMPIATVDVPSRESIVIVNKTGASDKLLRKLLSSMRLPVASLEDALKHPNAGLVAIGKGGRALRVLSEDAVRSLLRSRNL